MSLSLEKILISQSFQIWCPVSGMEVMKPITKFQLNISKNRPARPKKNHRDMG